MTWALNNIPVGSPRWGRSVHTVCKSAYYDPKIPPITVTYPINVFDSLLVPLGRQRESTIHIPSIW
jgi:hypothetical protein